ncbi:SixA phosphatase family protein [Massilia yuzhufengensis]|uniref:Phosphohistidine phosphatase SixA n=1 Tax=Massilia yuzhufengensis TaxID=1164594 RepID=A0A1I1DS79_9BURK|nr:phosphoglycerate mutase family protein [Massilia yuzhufengensis]SFB77889.1 Phosphohistidine phosphatase SixA [Massilia yuzhufengensis]
MRLPARLFRQLSIALAMLAPCAAMAEPSAIYLVRHGEKMSEQGDPDLSARGQARAQHVGVLLHRAGITRIFTTPTRRTHQTAEPLAQRLATKVEEYDPRNPKALVEKVKGLTGAVLVVGHSNTLPELVRLFGGAPGADIGDNEYDRLYQLTPGVGGAVNTVLLTTP